MLKDQLDLQKQADKYKAQIAEVVEEAMFTDNERLISLHSMIWKMMKLSPDVVEELNLKVISLEMAL